MAEVLMYDFDALNDLLNKNIFSDVIKGEILDLGASFDNTKFSIVKLGKGNLDSKKPAFSLIRKAGGKHTLNITGVPPTDIDGPKVPPKLE